MDRGRAASTNKGRFSGGEKSASETVPVTSVLGVTAWKHAYWTRADSRSSRLCYLDDSGTWLRSKGSLVTTSVTPACSLSSSALTVMTPCCTWGLWGMSVT